jgi:hypothetical protein
MTFSPTHDAVSQAPLLLIQSTAPSGFERWVDVIADVATIVIAVALIVAGLVAIFGALKVQGMLRRMRTDFDPAIRSANAVAENAKAMSDKLRGNVEELSATVSDTTLKVRRATDAAEAKVAELNALAGVVQREAEEAFVRAASAVRGVQVGTAALRRTLRRHEDDEGVDDLLDDETTDDEDEVPEVRPRGGRRTGRDIFDD